ncbi:MAG TPA: class I SAM-dependent methyltransferase [Dehalococcoidia bacterium]|nr:class I SAM-dependent methyltransferase [Dehalococcoidia bacterium]
MADRSRVVKGHLVYAAFYDLIAGLGGRRLRELRRFAAGGASGRVLEIGCGTGANFPFYDWSQVDSLDATEPDPFMLKRARRKLAGLPEGKVTLHEAPAEALPFPDETFDTAVSTLVFCTVDQPALAAAEVKRVLKPGGYLRLVEHVRATGRSAAFQDFVQPVYGWFSAGCVLGRNTELTLAAAGFRLRVQERPSFGPFVPGLVALAQRPPA